MHPLIAGADQVHFDTAQFGVEEGVVAEGIQVEIAVEFAVDAPQQVQVERRGGAGGIVVGGLKHLLILDQIDADQQPPFPAEHVADSAQEALGLGGLEVAYRRTGKEGRPRVVVGIHGQCERHRVVGADRMHLEVRKGLRQRACRLQQMISGDVHRHVDGRAQGLQQHADLQAAAAAEFHQQRVAAEPPRHLGAMFAQDGDLGAGRIVLGQHRRWRRTGANPRHRRKTSGQCAFAAMRARPIPPHACPLARGADRENAPNRWAHHGTDR